MQNNQNFGKFCSKIRILDKYNIEMSHDQIAVPGYWPI